MKYRVLLLLFVCLIFFQTQAQQQNRESVDLLIKLALFEDALGMGETVDRQLLDNFLQISLSIDTLDYSGFEHFDFYAISPEYDPNSVTFDKLPFLRDNCEEYIIAITKGGHKFYRLKGFYSNDFSMFLRNLADLNYEDIQSRRKFTYWYSVERLDLGCLYDAFKANSFNMDKYPCLHHCSEFITTH